MDKGFIVRSVQEADFPSWKVLWDGYNAFYGRAGATALDPEITATTRSPSGDSASRRSRATAAGEPAGSESIYCVRS